MAEFISGNGGYITASPTSEGGLSHTRLDIGKWTLRITTRLAENTHSGVSSTNFESVVRHNEWSLEVPLDIENFPENIGFDQADKVDIVFNIGESGNFYTLTGSSVETLEYVDDQSQDIVRIMISGKGGSIS